MRISVTGGAGFIGSHVVDGLLVAGHDVVVLDVVPPHRDVEAHAVDILDLDGLVRAIDGSDVVFHLAAVSNVNDAARDPVRTVDVNVTGTANVWEAARRGGVGRAVLASTVWVYAAAVGDHELDEDSPINVATAGHVYTATKIASEMIVHSSFDLYGQPFTILRYGIPFGPRMRDELVIARFVQIARAGGPITIDGDGLQHRSYVYIEDLVRGHLAALSESGENEVFNLEGPEPITIRRVADAVREAIDPRIEIVHRPARASDFAGRRVSARRARRLLGWEPRVSFDEGLRRYLESQRTDAGQTVTSRSDA